MHVQTLLTDLIGLSQFFFLLLLLSLSRLPIWKDPQRVAARARSTLAIAVLLIVLVLVAIMPCSCRLSLSLSLLLLHLQLHHAFSLLFFDSFQFLLERENQRITWRFMIFILSSSYFESLERLRYSSCCNLSFFSFSEKHAG